LWGTSGLGNSRQVADTSKSWNSGLSAAGAWLGKSGKWRTPANPGIEGYLLLGLV